MEIPEKIITQAFQKVDSSNSNVELKNILTTLGKFEVNKILLKGDKDSSLNNIYNEIYQITSQSHVNDQEPTNEFVSILININEYLTKAISKGVIKELLLFLSVNCYLKIELKHFLGHKELGKMSKAPIISNITKLLNSVKLETSLKTGASFYESELKKTSNDGIKEENIEKIYELILSIERGGRGFHFNYLLESLIYFLYQFDSKSFIIHLNSLKHSETVVFYLQSFPKKDLIKISTLVGSSNKWVLFELIRQIIAKEDKKNLPPKDCKAVIKCLEDLYSLDFNIYKQSIAFFHRSRLFNSSLGGQLKDLNKKEITEIFQNVLPIDNYEFNVEQRTILLEEFKQEVSSEIYKLVLKIVFKRWEELCLSIANDEDSYQNTLLLTDYANFVHQYYSQLSKKKVTDLLSDFFNKLIWINSEWFKSKSQLITKYNLYLTNLYLLSHSFGDKKITNTKALQLINDLKNSHLIELANLSNGLNPIEIIENNLK